MDAQSAKTSISAGLLVYRALSEDAAVSAMATKIFPVAVTAENVRMPFVVFRCIKAEPQDVKPGRGFDYCQVAVDCAGATYEEAVSLAEAARAALEESEISEEGLAIGISRMTDREEFYDEDSFVERLVFTITV